MDHTEAARSKAQRQRKRRYCSRAASGTTAGCKLQDQLRGFLVTCNQKEYQCLQECYTILNGACDRLLAATPTADLGDQHDVEACIQAEIEADSCRRRRLLQVKTKCKNVLFIRLHEERLQPGHVLAEVWRELEQNGGCQSRFIQRIVPVSRSCRADKLLEELPGLVDREASKRVQSYAVHCRVRNNSAMAEKQLLDQVVAVVRDKRANWYVNLDRPDTVLQVDVIGKAACVSLLPDYHRYCKYNLAQYGAKCMGPQDAAAAIAQEPSQ